VDAPLAAAMTVLTRRSLPTYLDRARGPYPQIDQLPPARQAALASLVYNRGAGLQDSAPRDRQNRREMREIQTLLAAGRLDEVADQIDAMVRLWDPAKAAGLIKRRRREATLWRAGFAALQLV
jgi:GH24 family phage-related lysozyme (muramidase)